MRRLGILALLLAHAGCGAPSPCDGVVGACIGAHVSGDVANLEQLLIRVGGQPSQGLRSPTLPAPIHLPAKLSLQLPTGTHGSVDVVIWGLSHDGVTLASVAQTVTLPPSGHVDANFLLSTQGPAMPDAAVDGGETRDLGTTDGGSLPADLAPPPVVITGAVAQTLHELDSLHLALAASDPQLSAVQLTVGGLPSTALYTGSGAGGSIDWTPNAGEAGVYPISVTATPADAGRAVTQRFTITVLNTVDPVLNPAGIVPDQLVLQPVGDVDGDGLADLAACSIVQGAGAAQYTVAIIYGDAGGLPLTRPYPSSRWRSFSFSGPTDSVSTSNVKPSCIGGDFDGDGKSDVLLADLSFKATSAGSVSGAYYVLYGQARSDPGSPATALLLLEAGDTFVAQAAAGGDWSGDKIADFAIMGFNGTASSLYTFLGSAQRSATPTPAADVLNCGDAQLIGFSPSVASDHSRSDALVWGCSTTGVLTWSLGINGQGTVPATEYPTVVGDSYALCDLDGDGTGDLVVGQSGGGMLSLSILYGVVGSSWRQLDANTPSGSLTFTGDTPRYACWPTTLGGKASVFAVGDTQQQGTTGDGYGQPGTLRLVGVDGSGVPGQSGTLGNYADSSFSGWGQIVRAAGDVNGDGKPDLIVGYQNGNANVPFASVVYGR